MTSSKNINLGPTKKLKPSGNVKFIKDYIFDPSNPVDYASYAIGGPVARAVGGIAKAGAKYVSKLYR